MNTPNTENSLKEQVDSLENSIGQLLEICSTLSVENAAFKKSNHQLLIDRSELHEKNDKARVQVEAMINRLKTIDNAS
jgi:cell division protein ZapB